MKQNELLYIRINPQLKPELVMTDDSGRFDEMEVNLRGIKILILGIYAPK